MPVLADLIPLFVSILTAAPQVVGEIESVWNLLTAQAAPTADEQKTIDDALAAAHNALQAS